jgi:hypothetical protein
MAGHELLVWATQNATKGGSRETEVKEFAANPAPSPDSGSTAVIAMTPVAK